MLLRCTKVFPPGVADAELLPFVRQAFETGGRWQRWDQRQRAKVGVMRPTDPDQINRDYLIYNAKKTVLDLWQKAIVRPG